MKSNINQTPLRTYAEIPKKWELRTDVFGDYSKLTKDHYKDGWRDYIAPQIGENQRRGERYHDTKKDIVTERVIDLTAEEIEQMRRSSIPQEIKPSQGKIQLHRMGILETVNQMIADSGDVELKLFWEYALTWELENSYIQSLAAVLKMTREDVEGFFVAASEIN